MEGTTREKQEPQEKPEEKPEGLAASPGLPPGRAAERPERDVGEVVGAAADDRAVTAGEADALLDYYLGNTPKPGTSPRDIASVEVDLGRSGAKWKAKVSPISWTQFREAQMRGEKPDGSIDTLVIAAWCVAQALVEPQLGPTVQRLQHEASSNAGVIRDPHSGQEKPPPEHAPALLLDFFERQPGSLLELNRKVLEVSKLETENNAVREIEAGKT